MAILQRRSIELQQQIENKNKQIEELTPDAESWRKFVDSDGTFTASNVAKLLHISRDNDLIPFLLLKKYIMRERHDNPKHGTFNFAALVPPELQKVAEGNRLNAVYWICIRAGNVHGIKTICIQIIRFPEFSSRSLRKVCRKLKRHFVIMNLHHLNRDV